MLNLNPMQIVEELEKGLGEGDLCLGIFCHKCDAQFALNNEAVALAIMLNTTFIEYVRAVQNSTCPECNPKEKKDE